MKANKIEKLLDLLIRKKTNAKGWRRRDDERETRLTPSANRLTMNIMGTMPRRRITTVFIRATTMLNNMAKAAEKEDDWTVITHKTYGRIRHRCLLNAAGCVRSHQSINSTDMMRMKEISDLTRNTKKEKISVISSQFGEQHWVKKLSFFFL